MTHFCTSCGKRLDRPDSKFCTFCGQPLAAGGAPAPVSTTPTATPVIRPQPFVPTAPVTLPPPPARSEPAAPAYRSQPEPRPAQRPRSADRMDEPARPESSDSGQTLGEIAGVLGGLSGVASSIASAMGARDLAAGLSVASNAANTVASMFKKIRTPSGREVVVGACTKSKEDDRDAPYEGHDEVDPSDLPEFVDLREHLSEIESQGEIGSCTANAIAGAYEYLQKRLTGDYVDVSRLFIYYLERKMDGTEDEDAGANLRDGMKVLKKHGVCEEEIWPYDVDRWAEAPSEEAMAAAREHTIDEYRRVPIELEAMKACLAEGYPFVFGLELYSSFEKHGTHGMIALPDEGEESLGGHAMLCVGYSDEDQVFVVRNSWGSDWGDEGYCYIPYDYLTDEDYAHDAFTLRKAHNLDFSTGIHGGEQHVRSDGTKSFFGNVEGVVDIAAGIFGGKSFVDSLKKAVAEGEEDEEEEGR